MMYELSGDRTRAKGWSWFERKHTHRPQRRKRKAMMRKSAAELRKPDGVGRWCVSQRKWLAMVVKRVGEQTIVQRACVREVLP